MDRDEILVEIRQILQDFLAIKLQILNDRHWPVNRFWYCKINQLKNKYTDNNTDRLIVLEAHLRAITTWIALHLENLHEIYLENRALRIDIENLQKRILELERYTIVSLNKKTIKYLQKVIYYDLLNFYDIYS